MKYKAARSISRKLAGMTRQQQLKFWKQKHDELIMLQKDLSRRKKAVKKSSRLG
jgi:hypothetical protein